MHLLNVPLDACEFLAPSSGHAAAPVQICTLRRFRAVSFLWRLFSSSRFSLVFSLSATCLAFSSRNMPAVCTAVAIACSSGTAGPLLLLALGGADDRSDATEIGEDTDQASEREGDLEHYAANHTQRQELVDKDAEVRGLIAHSMEARTASVDRMSHAFEMMAVALLTKQLGANAVPLIQAMGLSAPAVAPAMPPATGIHTNDAGVPADEESQ